MRSERIAMRAMKQQAAGPYAVALVGVVLAALVARAGQRWLGLPDPSPVFMLAVILIGLRCGYACGLISAALSVLAYSYLVATTPGELMGVLPVMVICALLAAAAALTHSSVLASLPRLHAVRADGGLHADERDASPQPASPDQFLTALLASLAHDLRGPLSVVLGVSESLARYWGSLDKHDRLELLATAKVEGERMDRYIQNILDITRAVSDSPKALREPACAVGLVDAAIQRLQRMQPGARVELTAQAELPPVWVHTALAEQAVFNILHNAAKFSPAGAPVAVRVYADPDQRRCVIEIRDHGPGIPPEESERVFAMFETGEAANDEVLQRTGSGLGLSIARSIVRSHGGEVRALPRPDGWGTLAQLALPFDAELGECT